MEFKGNAEALMSIRHKLSQLSKVPQPSIYKVHKHLRNISDKAYEPDIIAIGPYHHGKDSLKMMEEHKLRYLESLLKRRKENVERYITAVGEMEQEARNYYAEPISFNAAKFIEMLVLDGCFIIELILKNISGDSTCNDPIFQTMWIMNSLKRDLILLENQIPFVVLCKLFDLIEAPNQYSRLIDLIEAPNQYSRLIDLVLNFFESLYPGAVFRNRTNRSSQEVKHLLDLIHSNWRPPPDDVSVNVDEEASDNVSVNGESLWIHSATELKDANVEFQMRVSETLFDVDFKEGRMLMPPLTIEDRTECFFRNLIAYEQYFPNNQPIFVTDYVTLLDCLINSSRDVEILSQCEIIDNGLGDNEVVANIFNKLTDSVTLYGDDFVYAKTFGRINRHYKKSWNRAMAGLKRDYFASHWSRISVVAASVLLLLTVAQTVLSVLQVV